MPLDIDRIAWELRPLTPARRVARLEALFLSELQVVGAIYGSTGTAHVEWAARVMGCPRLAQLHTRAWAEGKRQAWKGIAQLSELLRRASGEHEDAWKERLTLLELAAGREVQPPAPPASTFGAALHRT